MTNHPSRLFILIVLAISPTGLMGRREIIKV
jgi:hypothetical protein